MTVRIGVLGAADIAPAALLRPALAVPGVEVVAVAARDRTRARAFAEKHGIPEVVESYDALLERDDIDAVYIGLIASAHHEWTARALERRKHVLCEKPLTLTEAEARDLVDRAATADRMLVEAFHYRYHPYFDALAAAVADIGPVERIEAVHHNNVPRRDVYWDRTLGGGSTLHLGGYAVHVVRALLRDEPDVVAVDADIRDGVDVRLAAELRFPGGATGRVASSMDHDRFENWVRIEGERGVVTGNNFIVPHHAGLLPGLEADLTVQGPDGRVAVTSHVDRPTYEHQLRAFVAAVADGMPVPTSGDDSIAQARVLDAMHAGAGLTAIPE